MAIVLCDRGTVGGANKAAVLQSRDRGADIDSPDNHNSKDCSLCTSALRMKMFRPFLKVCTWCLFSNCWKSHSTEECRGLNDVLEYSLHGFSLTESEAACWLYTSFQPRGKPNPTP
jgi:hypothetical protein